MENVPRKASPLPDRPPASCWVLEEGEERKRSGKKPSRCRQRERKRPGADGECPQKSGPPGGPAARTLPGFGRVRLPSRRRRLQNEERFSPRGMTSFPV